MSGNASSPVIPNGNYIPVVNVDTVIDALPLSTNLTKLLRAANGQKAISDITMEFPIIQFRCIQESV